MNYIIVEKGHEITFHKGLLALAQCVIFPKTVHFRVKDDIFPFFDFQ
jgi:hypothetical protein